MRSIIGSAIHDRSRSGSSGMFGQICVITERLNRYREPFSKIRQRGQVRHRDHVVGEHVIGPQQVLEVTDEPHRLGVPISQEVDRTHVTAFPYRAPSRPSWHTFHSLIGQLAPRQAALAGPALVRIHALVDGN